MKAIQRVRKTGVAAACGGEDREVKGRRKMSYCVHGNGQHIEADGCLTLSP